MWTGDLSVDPSRSPFEPGASPVRIRVRDGGAGTPVVVLHGGWGYAAYPFDRQIDALAESRRVLAPDRSGYGRSMSIASLPTDFHRRAMEETRALVDTLGLERTILWGHSDGAVIALLFALAHPDRLEGVIVEASHYYRRKPSSRSFFERMLEPRGPLGGLAAALEADHGARWPDVIRMHADAWIRIGDEAASDRDDFYDGRLSQATVPVLVVHGARDPRTEPGELEAFCSALARSPSAARAGTRVAVLDEGAHSPHSEPATADEVTQIACRFIDGLRPA